MLTQNQIGKQNFQLVKLVLLRLQDSGELCKKEFEASDRYYAKCLSLFFTICN